MGSDYVASMDFGATGEGVGSTASIAPTRRLRPRLSVCLATYNGQSFLQEQLASVLSQLDPEDEVVIVDDASKDRTREMIRDLKDDRIRLIEHRQQQGVVKTFEHAVRSASGEIIFLCDQDDLWAPNKVTRMMDVFAHDPGATIVTSKVRTIDENGGNVENGYSPRPFSSSVLANLLSNRFQGAAMAFRSSLIPKVLPFPEGFHLLHDAWIGIRNAATRGRTVYIDEELLFYRRHSGNASHRLSVVGQILKRLRLLVALVSRSWQDRANRSNSVP